MAVAQLANLGEVQGAYLFLLRVVVALVVRERVVVQIHGIYVDTHAILPLLHLHVPVSRTSVVYNGHRRELDGFVNRVIRILS